MKTECLGFSVFPRCHRDSFLCWTRFWTSRLLPRPPKPKNLTFSPELCKLSPWKVFNFTGSATARSLLFEVLQQPSLVSWTKTWVTEGLRVLEGETRFKNVFSAKSWCYDNVETLRNQEFECSWRIDHFSAIISPISTIFSTFLKKWSLRDPPPTRG